MHLLPRDIVHVCPASIQCDTNIHLPAGRAGRNAISAFRLPRHSWIAQIVLSLGAETLRGAGSNSCIFGRIRMRAVPLPRKRSFRTEFWRVEVQPALQRSDPRRMTASLPQTKTAVSKRFGPLTPLRAL